LKIRKKKKEEEESHQNHCMSVFYGSLNIKLLCYITSQQREKEPDDNGEIKI
jgi:hypothetical protein